jgi:hypothetical protein
MNQPRRKLLASKNMAQAKKSKSKAKPKVHPDASQKTKSKHTRLNKLDKAKHEHFGY